MDERKISQELGKLPGMDSAKEAEISLLKDEVKRLKRHNAALRAALKEKEEIIKRYEFSLDSLRSRIAAAGEILSGTLHYPDD